LRQSSVNAADAAGDEPSVPPSAVVFICGASGARRFGGLEKRLAAVGALLLPLIITLAGSQRRRLS